MWRFPQQSGGISGQAVELIRSHRHALAIDGIRYVKLDGQEYYVQEIFDTTELLANLDRNAVKGNTASMTMWFTTAPR